MTNLLNLLSLHHMRLDLQQAYKGTILTLTTVRHKTADGCGMHDRQTHDARAYFTTCTLQPEILILQAFHMHRTHVETGQDQGKGACHLAAHHCWWIFSTSGWRMSSTRIFAIMGMIWDFERGVLQMTSLSGMLI